MVVLPKVRGFICTTAHPLGCAAALQEQIDVIEKDGPIANGPKKVLILGASTGFGLSTRVTAAFGSGAATLGVFFERGAEKGRTASPGWYQSAAFHEKAQAKGLYAKSINGDAFSDEVKKKTIETLKKDLGQIDLLVYSLAAPRRTDPKTGEVYRSVLRPTGEAYNNKTMDATTGVVSQITIDPASDEEIRNTIGVMGGDDWVLWTEALLEAEAFAPGALNIAYSYVGPRITEPIYRNGTIGSAKADLEAKGRKIDTLMQKNGGHAFVSVNKCLVTQASSAIPVIPLYVNILYKVMIEKGVHEGCIEQLNRLFRQRLYTEKPIAVDSENRIRIDDWELREDVQEGVEKVWSNISTENMNELADLRNYNHEFIRLFGFELDGVDYDADVEIDVPLQLE